MPQGYVYSRAPASNYSYLMDLMSQYSTTYDTAAETQHQHHTQPAEHASGLAVIPASDTVRASHPLRPIMLFHHMARPIRPLKPAS
ncbi:hypothetical protein BGY98DRAFT_346476 [Russula aff. rugulosa BPL654]|nr:hypothetical protein BGY98DRAFT_346476 [Russula aff. rugulosa BPL654]